MTREFDIEDLAKPLAADESDPAVTQRTGDADLPVKTKDEANATVAQDDKVKGQGEIVLEA